MKHHIVAIGISKHKNSNYNLSFAEKDATEFFSLFTQNISDIGYSRLLVDQEATLSEIKTALGKELRDEVNPGDAFFFFYSGHGALAPDPQDQNTALSFLVPYDATHDIPSTCLSVDDIKKIFESLPSQANLIFIDSCFSGSVSKQGKSYPIANTKSFKALKSFSNTVIGNGNAIFTASKDDELSLEDPEYENGIFTHFVLEELQKQRTTETFSATEIFSPVVAGVTARAKDKWKHTQTPTFLGKLVGDLKLPVFKKRLHIKPDTIEIPKNPELQNVSFPIPTIDLTDPEKGRILQQTIDFVSGSSGASTVRKNELAFERVCHRMIQKIKADWEMSFQEAGSDVAKIPEAMAQTEANSYQFMMLGAATAVYGSPAQMKIYSEYLSSLLDLTKSRSGLIALIAVPEVIVVEALYMVAIICLERKDLGPLGILLSAKYDDPEYYSRPPVSLLENKYIHYTRALTGSSTKVNDHIREHLRGQDWIVEFAPKLAGKTDDYQLQANLLLVMLTQHQGDGLWADFGRFYAERVMPIARMLLYDEGFREQLAGLMGIKENEVRPKFIQYLKEIRERGMDNHIWSSIDEGNLMTEEERRAAGVTGRY